MPMIKRRRKMDKKKRKCLFGPKKQTKPNESTETMNLEQQDSKKTKVEKIVDIKKEVLMEANHKTKSKSKPKCQLDNESTKEKEQDQSKEEANVVEEEISTCKLSIKTKQRCVFKIHYIIYSFKYLYIIY